MFWDIITRNVITGSVQDSQVFFKNAMFEHFSVEFWPIYPHPLPFSPCLEHINPLY